MLATKHIANETNRYIFLEYQLKIFPWNSFAMYIINQFQPKKIHSNCGQSVNHHRKSIDLLTNHFPWKIVLSSVDFRCDEPKPIYIRNIHKLSVKLFDLTHKIHSMSSAIHLISYRRTENGKFKSRLVLYFTQQQQQHKIL